MRGAPPLARVNRYDVKAGQFSPYNYQINNNNEALQTALRYVLSDLG